MESDKIKQQETAIRTSLQEEYDALFSDVEYRQKRINILLEELERYTGSVHSRKVEK